MYTNILVALSSAQIAHSDPNFFELNSAERESFDISREVLDEAIALAKPLNATLSILHVLTEKEIQEGVKEHGSREKFEQEYQRHLKLLEDEVSAEGIDVCIPQISSQSRFAKPGEVICEHARVRKNDLIVVGRREHHFSLLGAGSVSHYVIYHAPCTTFVVNRSTSVSTEGTRPAMVHQ